MQRRKRRKHANASDAVKAVTKRMVSSALERRGDVSLRTVGAEAGVAHTTLSRMARGEREPVMSSAVLLFQRLGISFKDFAAEVEAEMACR
jgi:transcriptional regulator with XRE-family HTH domain